jgi:hypothetical protein
MIKLMLNLTTLGNLMSKKLIPIFAALFVTAASAQNLTANGFSYDYVQGYYESGNINVSAGGYTLDTDLSGAGAGFSKLLNENVFFTASFGGASSSSIKINNTSYAINTDITSTSFGVGYRMPLDAKTDLNVRASSVSTKVELNGYGYSISDTDRVTAVGVGVRYKLSDEVELNAGINSVDGESSTGFGGAMNLSKTVALIGGYSTSDNSSATFIGLRVMY